MQNKGLVISLAVVITLLCFYYLSFTFVSYNVQRKAVAAATDASGNIDINKKQAYLDSVWTTPVYNLLGAEFTFKEVKDSELSLGLDLQGGMHVTLEVSPADIIKSLSGNSQDSAFLSALRVASKEQKTSRDNYSTLFFRAFRKANPDKRLASIFANSSTRDKIATNDDDKKVIDVVDSEIESAIDRSFTILSNRLDQFGTSQPNIQRLPGTGRIQVEIPGADNPARVRKLLQGVARLEFWDVIEPNTLNTQLLAINDVLVKEQKAAAKPAVAAGATTSADTTAADSDDLSSLLGDSTKTASADSAAAQKGLDSLQNMANVSALFSLSNPPSAFRYALKDTAKINDIFRRHDIRNLLPRTVGVFWANKPDQVGNQESLELFFLDIGRDGKSRLTGEVITDAHSDLDEYARHAVSMKMNAKGTRTWAKWTAEAASKSPKGRIAITLDNTVYSAPSVNGEIPNGNSQISGNFTDIEAKDLANVLKAGSLPAPTKIVEESSVGPTLGAESIRNGILSIIVGFLIIIFFMLVVYNTSGWVADLAVILNLIFLLGVLASLNAALTLPGIAGILLSLAIAVDANVLINERVKEDLNSGKSLEASIRAGYKGAFSAIIDSNVTTFIKGLVLLTFGTGLIYGFALNLIIGIVCSFFTSVFFTRVIFEYYTRRGKKISFSRGWSKTLFRSINFDFIGNRKIYYTISGAIVVAGIVMIAFKGFNYGVDFKGGRTYIVGFEKSLSASDVRGALTKSFEETPEVKTFGGTTKYKITTSYLVDDDSDEATVKAEQRLEEGLATIGDNKAEVLSFYKVGPTIANDIKVSAVYSLLIAVVLMFLYILIRFRKWQFALGTVVSLFHTVLVVLSLFVLLEPIMPFTMEIDQAFVAAILTVIGYSINDSVVVFDRVREFLSLKKSSESTSSVVNNALNDTLSRTLITGMSTLFVLVILFFFGGETIKGFTFAMLIGVLIGTYSSLCIGTPVLVDFSPEEKQAEPKPVAA
ncbi:protein translocase subunit SecDF [Fulvivirgaceae bacterium PWU5]|uniref:Multifunctional fusion protein n=1 Tax=Dawidia cretensis TaxID=2782350 RepID=A0AAP2E1A8_9BACT|nr:protein translocase subunit SecDF [Dawidia cretensis]MBT1709777.1 protein translocase subunit SecDF [Dawidia cretensis]